MSNDLTLEGMLFMEKWQRDYPETLPINYHFKWHLKKRWTRIYSLPEAQRYPNDNADWDTLLTRQNAVIDYLVPQGHAIQWVFNWLGRDSHLFTSFSLTRLGIFRDTDAGAEYESWLLDDVWESGVSNTFLTMIADEQMRAFVITPDCLVSPYDGGMDVILKDPYTAHAFKRHFADWVSPREDGC